METTMSQNLQMSSLSSSCLLARFFLFLAVSPGGGAHFAGGLLRLSAAPSHPRLLRVLLFFSLPFCCLHNSISSSSQSISSHEHVSYSSCSVSVALVLVVCFVFAVCACNAIHCSLDWVVRLLDIFSSSSLFRLSAWDALHRKVLSASSQGQYS